MIHGLDITVALGIERHIAEARMLTVLRGLAKARSHFGVDLDGVELIADDLDWTLGSGAAVRGSAQDLLLVVCGRRLPQGRLRGEPSRRFTGVRTA